MARLGALVRRLLGTVAFRLALGYGMLLVGSMTLISVMLYFGTVGVLSRGIDANLAALSKHLAGHYEAGGMVELAREILQILDDGIDSDTEVFLLVGPDGGRIVGNLSSWPAATTPLERLTDQQVIRAGRSSVSRLLPHRLPNGGVLVVGRDMHDQREIELLVWRALATGGALALQLAIAGALLFRRQLEQRIATIRGTAMKIEAGDLGRRIPIPGMEDEFTRLGRDINRMLDRIQHLMDGVRHVSNAIAHDLRTPLGRIRSRLDEALLPGKSVAQVTQAAGSAIEAIDDVIAVFDKLLRIAEAESGTRRRSFEPVALGPLVTDVAELYDAMAEDKGIALLTEIDGEPTAFGDKDLLASAVANLVDNALKYPGAGATVRLHAARDGDTVSILVEDNGPGIAAEERGKVVERFYRVDGGRSQPGNGLGLALATAVMSLHGGALTLEDAAPGLSARLVVPRAEPFQTAC